MASIAEFTSLSRQSQLVDVLTRILPVQTTLLSLLDIKDIINVSKTTRGLAHLRETHVRVQGNINRVLENYFTSPVDFRNVQARTDALIAYDFAYDLFARTHPVHHETAFSILVEKGTSTRAMIECVQRDGWFREPDTLGDEYDNPGPVMHVSLR